MYCFNDSSVTPRQSKGSSDAEELYYTQTRAHILSLLSAFCSSSRTGALLIGSLLLCVLSSEKGCVTQQEERRSKLVSHFQSDYYFIFFCTSCSPDKTKLKRGQIKLQNVETQTMTISNQCLIFITFDQNNSCYSHSGFTPVSENSVCFLLIGKNVL